MRKLVLLIILAFAITGSLIAKEQLEKKLKPGDYKLVIENIKLDSFDFSNDNKIGVESENKVELTVKKGVISITADEETGIDLILPGRSSYKFTRKDNSVCKFDGNQINIIGNDGEIITFDSEGLHVQDGGDDVTISKDGIIVLSDDENVSISSKGIIVEGGDDDVHLTGFWGSMLGSMIKGVVGTTMSIAINNQEKIIKNYINEEDEDYISKWGNDNDSDYVKEKFEQNIPYKKNMVLTVLNENGRIKIDTWDKKEINVKAEKKIKESEDNYQDQLSNTKIDIEVGDNLHIETKKKGRTSPVIVSYTIMVPNGMKVDTIKSNNGSLILNGLENGDYKTTNGSIDAKNISGEFSLETANGRILAENCSGAFIARTSNGSINVKDCDAIRGLYSSNGSISFDLLNAESDINVETSNAQIKCNLLSNLDLKINADTTNGKIIVNNLELENVDRNTSYLYGEMNDAKYSLNLETSNGSIKIKEYTRSY